MAKILLAEDDNNLREIYEARLQAEGYIVISSGDGEEALVLAKDQLPDLIISDVMMPKISGFEMLDIIRNTDGLKNAKVIMLTALGQSEDQDRANKLGADKYLVKSQVTLEDIVKVAKELLNPTENSNNTSENQQGQEALDTQTQDTSMPLVPEPVQQEETPTEPTNPSQQPIDQDPEALNEENTTNNSTGLSNDQLLQTADNLGQEALDTQTQDTSMPLVPEPVQQEETPTEPTNPSQQPIDQDPEALNESTETTNINNKINEFYGNLGSEDSSLNEVTDNNEQQDQGSNQPYLNNPPIEQAPEVQSPSIQIPIQGTDSESDSSVPVSPPENVIPYTNNTPRTSIVNPDDSPQASSLNSSDNIDPTNITL